MVKPPPASHNTLLSPVPRAEEQSFELSLRPKNLRQYIGQNKVKENIEISIRAASNRREAMDHVLLYGPPGLGKTTLATVIANELSVSIRSTSADADGGVQEFNYHNVHSNEYWPTRLLQWLEEEDGYLHRL